MESFDPLGSGLSASCLLSLLWTKDEVGFGPCVFVPDTVVYKFGKAVAWYFTSKDGKLKRKHKQNVSNLSIEEAFRKVATCDIVACYMSEKPSTEGEERKQKEKRASGLQMEYLDAAGLRDFLYGRWKESSGLLQRFVESKGPVNSVIRCNWSPKVSLLEKRSNVHYLQDNRFGLYERAVTYEGPEHFSEAQPLRGATLPRDIQSVCENIQKHVSEVTFRKQNISKMVATFKVDASNKLWLLFATTVDRNLLSLPKDVFLSEKANHAFSETQCSTKTKKICSHCSSLSKENYPVQYKVIIAHHESFLSENHISEKLPKKVDLPAVLRKAHPKLTLEAYLKYKRDPLFLHKTTLVCESCFLFFADMAFKPPSDHDEPPPEDYLPKPPPPKKPVLLLRKIKKKLPPKTETKNWPQEPPTLPPAIYGSLPEEDALFRSDNKTLPKGHPLAHLVASRAILSSAPSTNHHAQQQQKKKKKSPYSVVQQNHNDDTKTSAAKTRKATPEETPPKLQKNNNFAPSASAIQHREFLLKTLEDLQRHLATPNSLQAWKQQTALELRQQAAEAIPSP